MGIPEKIPGLRGATAVLGVYIAIWISLEGALWRVVLMGVGMTAVLLAYGWQRWAGGAEMSAGRWRAATAVTGLLFGFGSSLLTFLFMIIKTGLHAHGPEFTPDQINWIIRQSIIWAGAGMLGGLGVGLLSARR